MRTLTSRPQIFLGTPVNSSVPISEALPAWTAYFTSGTTVDTQTQVSYDGISLGGPLISVIDANSPAFAPLQGTYSAFLFGGGNNPLYSASISQTGTVPFGTQSLLFDASVSGSPFVVMLGDKPLK